MSEATAAAFVCQACGKRYTWKPQLAGRDVQCKCGHVMKAPQEPPGTATPSATAPAATACPSCGAAMAGGAVICLQCGFNAATGKAVAARVTTAAELEKAELEAAEAEAQKKRKHRVAVLGMLAGGILILLITEFLSAGDAGFVGTLVAFVTKLALGTAAAVGFCYVAAVMFEIDFGELDSAALNLSMIYIFSAAVASLVDLIPLGGAAGVIARLIQLGLYFGLIMWLYREIEPIDAAVCVFILFFVRIFAEGMLIASLFSKAEPAAAGADAPTLPGGQTLVTSFFDITQRLGFA